MATPIMMPKVGISVESCILTQWHKKKGDTVKAGDLLFTYETDKSTLDETATVEGTMLEQFFAEGDDVPVMVNVCVIGAEGENIAEFAPAQEQDEEPAQIEEKKEEAAATPVTPVAMPVMAEGFVKASPRAKRLAEKTGADVRFAAGTGPEGRVIERDVRRLLAEGPIATYAAGADFTGNAGSGVGGKFSVSDIGAQVQPAQEIPAAKEDDYTEEKLSGIRKVIAKSMTTSLTTIPQLTHTLTFDATEIMAMRKKLKAGAEKIGLGNITLNDMVIYVVSRVLAKPEHRALNANFIGADTIRYFNHVNIGVAVDTERGLMVPTIFDADKKSLDELSKEAKSLAEACQKGNINPDLLSGAGFTISNLGVFGIESFTPVINPPQTGILGVDTITTRVKEVAGEIKTYPAMGLSLTYDHRAVDGAPASKFLVDLKNMFENFSISLCK